MASRSEASVLRHVPLPAGGHGAAGGAAVGVVVLQIFGPEPDCCSLGQRVLLHARAGGVRGVPVRDRGLPHRLPREHRAEDVVLNGSGFLPSSWPSCRPRWTRPARPATSPRRPSSTTAVTNNVWALFVAGVALVGVSWFLRARTAPEERGGSLSLWPLVVSSAALAVLPAVLVQWHDAVRDHGHDVAAIAAVRRDRRRGRDERLGLARHSAGAGRVSRTAANRYSAIGLAMLVSFAGLLVAHWANPGFHQWLFWLEALLIVEFAVFWVMQTVELWHVVQRNDSPRPSPGLTTPAPPPAASAADDSAAGDAAAQESCRGRLRRRWPANGRRSGAGEGVGGAAGRRRVETPRRRRSAGSRRGSCRAGSRRAARSGRSPVKQAVHSAVARLLGGGDHALLGDVAQGVGADRRCRPPRPRCRWRSARPGSRSRCRRSRASAPAATRCARAPRPPRPRAASARAPAGCCRARSSRRRRRAACP